MGQMTCLVCGLQQESSWCAFCRRDGEIHIARARLEELLRMAWRAGNGSRLHRDDREVADEDTYIAAALAEIEKEPAP